MSQLVPTWNFGWEDYQCEDNLLYNTNTPYEFSDKNKMVKKLYLLISNVLFLY